MCPESCSLHENFSRFIGHSSPLGFDGRRITSAEPGGFILAELGKSRLTSDCDLDNFRQVI
jgi:hypothetical protein